MKIGDIVTMVTPVGEVIGKLVAENEVELTLEDPRLFVPNEGGAGLAPGICMTGVPDTKEAVLFKGGIVGMVPTANELVSAWQQQTSGLVIPS